MRGSTFAEPLIRLVDWSLGERVERLGLAINAMLKTPTSQGDP